MLSSTSRALTYFVAILYAVLGLILFFAPNWSAANFAWNISPFVAMTMGGWCLGNAVFAWQSARLWRWPAVYGCLIYLWAFGLTQTAVLIAFRDRITLDATLAWPYIGTLLVTVVAAVLGIIEWFGRRPAVAAKGMPVLPWARALVILFVLGVGALAFLAIRAGEGGLATEGRVFPERLTLFTVRAFGAFYLSLVLGALPLTWATNREPMVIYGQAGLALIAPITAAALFHLDKFDFAARPGGLVYVAAYVIVCIFTVLGLVVDRAQRAAAARRA